MDGGACALEGLLPTVPNFDVRALHAHCVSGAVRDDDLTDSHICGLFDVLLLLSYRAITTDADTSARLVLQIVVAAFSFSELSTRSTAVIPASRAAAAAGGVVQRVLACSESIAKRLSTSMEDNMGLVSMVTTVDRSSRTGPHVVHSSVQGERGRGGGSRRSAQPAQSEGRKTPQWDEPATLRACLLWLASHWPDARAYVLRAVLHALEGMAGELRVQHAHAVRTLLQVLLSFVRAEAQQDVPDAAKVLLRDESSARALLRTLSPFRNMDGMVTDTGSALGVYHDDLLALAAVVHGAFPSLRTHDLSSVLKAWRGREDTSAAALLLLHEAQGLAMGVLWRWSRQRTRPCTDTVPLPAEVEGILSDIVRVMRDCVSSGNSRLAQLGLSFLKHSAFLEALSVAVDEGSTSGHPAAQDLRKDVQLLIRHMLRGGTKHWNDTVNRQTAAGLQALELAVPSSLFEGVIASSFGGAERRVQTGQVRALPRVTGEGGPGGLGAPSPHGETFGRVSLVAGVHGKQPHVNITGVAPWAVHAGAVSVQHAGYHVAVRGSRLPPPLTSEAPALTSPPDGSGGGGMQSPQSTAMAAYCDYLQSLLPPAVVARRGGEGVPLADGSGGEGSLPHWLSPAPVYLPTLAFHDLVFGQELGACVWRAGACACYGRTPLWFRIPSLTTCFLPFPSPPLPPLQAAAPLRLCGTQRQSSGASPTPPGQSTP